MKRIAVLIDGTWNKEGSGADTNVAKLDSARKIQAFIKATAADGTLQHVHYHDGVGTEGDLIQKLLGGFIGLGLKKIIQDVYEFIVADYAAGDELYIVGFSRGAYAARALAGLIGACQTHWPNYGAATAHFTRSHRTMCRRHLPRQGGVVHGTRSRILLLPR